MSAYQPFRSAHEDSRATTRRAVGVDAKVRDRNGSRFTIRVVDLSRTGFRAESAMSIRSGAIVWLSLPGLQSLEAEIAWTRGEFVGAKFRQPLHEAVFDHITKLLR